MKRSMLPLLLLMLSLGGWAQTFTLRKGVPNTCPAGKEDVSIITEDSGSLYVLSINQHILYFSRLDTAEFKIKKTRSVEAHKQAKQFAVIDKRVIEDHVYLFYRVAVKGAIHVYGSVYDKYGTLLRNRLVGTFQEPEERFALQCRVRYSPDYRRALFIHEPYTLQSFKVSWENSYQKQVEKRNQNKQVFFLLLNTEDFLEIKKYEALLDLREDKITSVGFQVTGEGKVCYTYYKQNPKLTEQYFLSVYDLETEEDPNTGEISINEDEERELVNLTPISAWGQGACYAGLYRIDKQYGVYFMSIDIETGETEQDVMLPFSSEQVKDMDISDDGKTLGTEFHYPAGDIRSLFATGSYTLKDSSRLVLFEQVTRTSSVSITTMYYCNMLVLKVSRDGTLKISENIKRRNEEYIYVNNDRYNNASHFTHLDHDSLYVFYHDHADNQDAETVGLRGLRFSYMSVKTPLVCESLQCDKITRKKKQTVMTPDQREGYKLHHESYYSQGDHGFLMVGQSGIKFQIFRFVE